MNANMVDFLFLAIGLYFALSAIIMALWNGPVAKALRPGAVQKINYGTALGLTFFIMLIMPSGVYLIQKKE